MSLDAVLSRIDDDLDEALERLMEFVRIPSISTDPAFAKFQATLQRWFPAES